MSYAGKNLKYLRKLRGLTQEEFAAKIHIKRSLLGAYEEERAEPRLEVLEAVSSLFKLTLDELLLTDLSAAKGNGYTARRRAQKLAAARGGEISFVPVKAAAGYLAGYSDPEYIDELNTFTLPMLAPGEYRAFEISGDSMLPTPSGSVIIGEKVNSMDEIRNNQTYILLTRNEGVVYKRVQKNGRVRGRLTLVSDNSAYAPYTVSAADILEVWKATAIITRVQAQPRWDVHQLASMVSDLQDQVRHLKNKVH